MDNSFESPFKGIPLDQQVTHPNIQLGRYSYYSGYYHGHGFDECARYLSGDEGVDQLIIGSLCSIGSGAAFIMAGNQGHRSEWISTFPFYWMPEEPAFAGAGNGYAAAGDTVVGNDAWIGSEAIVMPGIKIGDGAVIGTRALVTRDVEPYAIVGGNPAKTIRKRFDERSIAMLLEMQWWNWNNDQLKAAMALMSSSDIEGLLQYWQAFVKAS